MVKAHILHNPTAGEAGLKKQQLIELVEASGYQCSYSSTKDFQWEKIESSDADFIVVAGGDGTVRKIAKKLLGRRVLDRKLPIALLPMGTANNIAKTLKLSDTAKQLINGWKYSEILRFDVGRITGFEDAEFFLESFGYGIFPRLMAKMKTEGKNDIEEPQKKIKASLEMLHEMILHADAKKCTIEIDGVDYSGDYILSEVMNTKSIGPNLHLAPLALPDDGHFDVVLISEKQRNDFARYVANKMKDIDDPFAWDCVKAKSIKMFWHGKFSHADDEYFKEEDQSEICIELQRGLLEFIVPSPVSV